MHYNVFTNIEGGFISFPRISVLSVGGNGCEGNLKTAPGGREVRQFGSEGGVWAFRIRMCLSARV